MRKQAALLLGIAICLAAPFQALGQKFQPKTIQFKGAPEYTTEELLSAAELQPSALLDFAEMNAHAQKLSDTGLFSNLTFKFDGVDLIFQLVPSDALVPARFENLPFPAGPAFHEVLHKRLPLFHGKVPASGGLADSLRSTLEQVLKERGIVATVEAVPVLGAGPDTVGALSFSITAPPVLIGVLATQGAVVGLDPKATALVASLSGRPYTVEGSTQQIETTLSNYYSEQGYLETAVHATAADKPVVTPDAVRVPFRVTIEPGVRYRIAAIQLAPGMAVSQADFDRQANIHPGDFADGTHIRENWAFLSRQYHDNGYLQAKITATPTFDREHATVTYSVTANAGLQYTLASLAIENVTDELRASILSAWSKWKMPIGAIYNEGAIRGFFATHGVNPALERVFSQVDIQYTPVLHDDTRTVDLTIRLEKKH